jgi:SAM-dependent methyltransferase
VTRPALALNTWLRYDVVQRLWRRIGPVERIVEVGAGLGAVGVRLAENARHYTGYEPDATSAAVARSRFEKLGRGEVVVALLEENPAAGDADVLVAFEVLEHIDDDIAALRSWATHVKPGGWLMISVPGFQDRFGPFDTHVGHLRRYDPDLLRQRLLAAGLEPVEIRPYGWGLGYALEHARNLVAKRAAAKVASKSAAERTAGSARIMQPPDSIGFLTAAAVAPFRLLQRAQPDKGTGIVALARKPRP